jgi:hypothetical protein
MTTDDNHHFSPPFFNIFPNLTEPRRTSPVTYASSAGQSRLRPAEPIGDLDVFEK